jgi:thiol-disulfide isomerase/thioredoxin
MVKAGKLGVFFGVALACSLYAADTDNLVGKSAPEITVREWITANPPDMASLAGRVYVVEFWATWCHPCIEFIPHLVELSNEYKSCGVEFIALSQDKSARQLRKFVQEKHISYPVAVDNGTADVFGITGYPTVAVVDHLGKVAWQGHPWNSGFEQALRRAAAAGPPPLLAGVDLGPFSHLRAPLWGGKGFAEAYREIASQIDNHRNPEISAFAKQIVRTINLRIARQISAADHLLATDRLGAYIIYADIVARYDGIEIVEPARKTWLEIKAKYPEISKQMFASRKGAAQI